MRPAGDAPFPPALTAALFDAVLADDEIDPHLALPAAVRVDYGEADLRACFRLCLQLWEEAFDRDAVAALAGRLIRTRDLGEAERAAFKHSRAKFKHLRYAHALYGAGHCYPPLLNRVTITMGQAQDAFRNGRDSATALRGAQLRLLLARPIARRLRIEAGRLALTTPAAFAALLRADYDALERLAARPMVTGHAFHAARKIVGRQVSFWDTLRTLAPDEDRFRTSRWLSAINGRMGALHDDLVARRAADRGSYAAPFALPAEIREPVAALVARARGS